MRSQVSLTAVLEPVEEGWTQARIREIPGVITAAPTEEEAKDLLLDALREYLLARADTDPSAGAPGAHEFTLDVTISA